MVSPQGEPAAGEIAARRYRLDRKLASGGMGVVYSAYDTLAKRHVAYKRLLISDEAQRQPRTAFFQREYDMLSRLRHPNIIEVYEYGIDEHGPYYTMELLSGQDLSALAPLPYREVCKVVRDVASALALVHARGYVHRDVTPANVRLTSDGRAKLFDFGALAEFGPMAHIVGTPAFLAPECLGKRTLDQCSDLYSVGALLYWALTRQLAVRARDLSALPAALRADIVPPSKLVEDIPAGLEELTLALLQHEPLARPNSAAEVIERLSAVGALEPQRDEDAIAYGYLAHPRMVGRGEQLSWLRERLDHVLAGGGRNLMLTAASGCGRSALLEAIVRKAQLAGASVLRVDAGLEAGAFGVALAVARQVRAFRPELVHKRESWWDSPAAPAPGGAVAAWSPVDASERKLRIVTGISTLVREACRSNPSVLVIDEIQRADADSLAWLATLMSELSPLPLLVLLSAEASSEWQSSDLRAAIESKVERLSLGPLSEEQIAELVTAAFGKVANATRLAHWLYARSGGNPARCMDLARVLLQRNVIRYTGGVFTLPHDVAEDWEEGDDTLPILARLRDLGAPARELAHFLSIQEVPLSLATLSKAMRAAPSDVLLSVEQLIARDVVYARGETYAIARRSLAAAVRGTLDQAVLRALHERAARVLLAEADSAGDHQMRLQAGVHLLAAGRQAEAAALLTPKSESDWMAADTPIQLLEAIVEIERARGRSDEHCLRLLVPLVRSGFFGELATQNRHLDRTLSALARVLGLDFATRWAPRLGDKLALSIGVGAALLRHAATPKELRYGSFEETFTALLSILSSSVAAVASTFDAPAARAIVDRFAILEAFGKDSAPALSLEFCRATAEMPAGRFADAIRRFQRLLTRFERPVKGMNETVHLQFRLGVLHGLAQSQVMDTLPSALALADQLERSHPFFAPHAETIRMGYHAYRGEHDLAESRRQRAETLALQGGVSWSAVTITVVRACYVAQHTGDAVEITRLLPELERMAKFGGKLRYFHDCARAYLELLRGNSERAAEAYERCFQDESTRHVLTYAIDRAHYARALCALGRFDQARRVCGEVSAALDADEVRYLNKMPRQQAALAQLGQGEVAESKRALEQLVLELAPYDNPLWLGDLHRDLARIALASGDDLSLQNELKQIHTYFRQTGNAVLIQQAERLTQLAETRARNANDLLLHEIDVTQTVIET